MGRMAGFFGRSKKTVLAVVVAVVLVGTPAAFAANGKPFTLGKKNSATKVSTLAKRGAGPALSLVVGSGAPLAVNSAVKVVNLNADRLDGLDATAFLRATGKAADAEKLDGKNSTQFAQDANQNGKADAAENADQATNATNADKLDNKDSTDFLGAGQKAADSAHADNADKLGGAPAGDYQRKCQKGSVTGHVVVNDPASLPNTWTEANGQYISSYNCTGQPIRVIRYGPGRYAVQFAGQEYMGRTAVASVESGYGRDDAFANTSFVFHYGNEVIARDVNVRRFDGTFVDSSFQLVAFD